MRCCLHYEDGLGYNCLNVSPSNCLIATHCQAEFLLDNIWDIRYNIGFKLRTEKFLIINTLYILLFTSSQYNLFSNFASPACYQIISTDPSLMVPPASCRFQWKLQNYHPTTGICLPQLNLIDQLPRPSFGTPIHANSSNNDSTRPGLQLIPISEDRISTYS